MHPYDRNLLLPHRYKADCHGRSVLKKRRPELRSPGSSILVDISGVVFATRGGRNSLVCNSFGAINFEDSTAQCGPKAEERMFGISTLPSSSKSSFEVGQNESG